MVTVTPAAVPDEPEAAGGAAEVEGDGEEGEVLPHPTRPAPARLRRSTVEEYLMKTIFFLLCTVEI